MLPELTIESLLVEAADFSIAQSSHHDPELYGNLDGKTIGTYLERRIQDRLRPKYVFRAGSATKGMDFPDLNVDIKSTSITKPQSSSPFRSARQKILGLGYSLLIFVYEKTNDHTHRTGNLNILHTIFVDAPQTADYQTTRRILEIVEGDGNAEDIVAYMNDRNLPIDDDVAFHLAEELLKNPPTQGYLTISNALQWRLHYSHVIEKAGTVPGVLRVGSQ